MGVTYTYANGLNSVPITSPGDTHILGSGVALVIDATFGNTIVVENGLKVVSGGPLDQITLGSGVTILFTAPMSQVEVGNGSSLLITGPFNQISVGNGAITLISSPFSQIDIGNGFTTIVSGASSEINLGNGTATVIAGESSTVTVGNGSTSIVGHSGDFISLGDGHHTVNALNDLISAEGDGLDTFVFDRGPTNISAIFGFDGNDVIEISSTAFGATSFDDLAVFSAGTDTVINADVAGFGDLTVILFNVDASTLDPARFSFFA